MRESLRFRMAQRALYNEINKQKVKEKYNHKANSKKVMAMVLNEDL